MLTVVHNAIDAGVDRVGDARLGCKLAANGRNMSKPACAGLLIEAELHGQVGNREEGELLWGGVLVGVLSLTLGHSDIIARGCDTVVG